MRILTNKISVKKIRPVITSVEISQVRKVMAALIQSANSEITEEIKEKIFALKLQPVSIAEVPLEKSKIAEILLVTAQLDSKIKCSDSSNCSTETSSSGPRFK